MKRLPALAALFLTLTFISAYAEDYAEVFYFSGDVQVLLDSAGETEWSRVRKNVLLEAGDSIKVGADSMAELNLDGDEAKLIRLSGNTQATIIFDSNEKIELLEGEVFASIKNISSGSTFEIRTPTAICGVRGTDWSVKATAENTDVEAFDDDLYVKNIEPDGTVTEQETPVFRGYKTQIAKFQKPRQQERIPNQRLERWRSLKGDLDGRVRQGLIKKKQPPMRRQNRQQMPYQRKSNQSLPPDRSNPSARQAQADALEGRYRSMEQPQQKNTDQRLIDDHQNALINTLDNSQQRLNRQIKENEQNFSNAQQDLEAGRPQGSAQQQRNTRQQSKRPPLKTRAPAPRK